MILSYPIIMTVVFSTQDGICGAVEQWKRGLKSDGSYGSMICGFPDDYKSCLPNVIVDLCYCGAVVATEAIDDNGDADDEVLVQINMWIKVWTKFINN